MSQKPSRSKPRREAMSRPARRRRSSKTRRLIAIAILVLAVGLAAVVAVVVARSGHGEVNRPKAPATSAAASRFAVVLTNGQRLTGRELAGRPAVAGFVIEDCSSCVATLKTLADLSKDGIRAIAVNLNAPAGSDPAVAAQRLAAFGEAVGVKGPQYAADPGTRTATAYEIRQVESFLIFDARGREAGRGIGLSAEQIRRTLGGA